MRLEELPDQSAVAARVRRARARIAAAAARAGRDPSDVLLIAVGKTFPADALLEAFEAGVEDFGENRAQDLTHKSRLLDDRVRWHFVGPLQANKVRSVAGVALIHSVDREDVAAALARRARAREGRQDVLIEVNLGAEATKHGTPPEDTPGLGERIARLEGVRVRGLMTIPPIGVDAEASRPFFRQLAALGRDLTERLGPDASELSMGMTGDFEVAIEEGATMVRLGEAIFGPRRSGRAPTPTGRRL